MVIPLLSFFQLIVLVPFKIGLYSYAYYATNSELNQTYRDLISFIHSEHIFFPFKFLIFLA
jgi:hypothetical protein